MVMLLLLFAQARTLGDHTFGHPIAVEPTFVTPFLNFRQGVGYLALPNYRFPGIPRPLPLKLAGLTESLGGQFLVTDSVAVFLRGSGSVLSGLDSNTVLFLGARASYELRAGVRVEVHRSQRTQMSVRFGGRAVRSFGVIPADLAVAVLDDTQRALDDVSEGRWADRLLHVDSRQQGVVGVAGAFDAGRDVGLLSSLSLRIGSRAVSDEGWSYTGLGLQLGAGLAVDVRPGGKKLGLQVGLSDRLDRTSGLPDSVPERHRLTVPGQVYWDHNNVQLGFVPSFGVAVGSGATEIEGALEGRAVAFF